MVPMGALQPGLPSPVAIPANYYKIVIDLKDCFFTIPLHPEDRPYFAFSVPQINFQSPMPRYQWKVLPQGMANSPTLCQKFVAAAIAPVRKQWPQAYILHYMDDILLACPDGDTARACHAHMITCLANRGLQIAPDKVQTSDPYSYLGFELCHQQVLTPRISLRTDNLKTLNDFQKLLGDIQWLRPYLKLPTEALLPLNNILKGDSDPLSPRALTPEAEHSLTIINKAIQGQSAQQISYNLPLVFILLPTAHTPTGVFWQTKTTDLTKNGHPLLWVHLPASPSRVLLTYPSLLATLIIKGRSTSRQLFGKDPDSIITPYSHDQTNWLLQTSDEWAIALSSFTGNLDNHYPSDPLVQFAKTHQFIFSKLTKAAPIPKATLVFTDGSSNGTAAYIINKQTFTVKSPYSSAQLVELFAILEVFTSLANQPFNLYTDSAYIAQSVPLLETVPFIKPSTNATPLFTKLQNLILQRQHPFYIGHLRAHLDLPGPLTEGNALADVATQTICPILTDPVTEATQAHTLHHLNAHTLRLLYKITRDQARDIVKACPHCITSAPVPHLGVNPRGLIPNAIWQMDITHFATFGKQKFIHVTVDTFSGFIAATPQTGEASKNVISHMIHCFSALGKPHTIKTDNGPGYTGKNFQAFCQQLQIKHITGIPYNPQGQGIVERAHQTLKNAINRLTHSPLGFSKQQPRNLLNHALFQLNFLTLDIQGHSAADRHWHPQTTSQQATVMWRDPLTHAWKGPDPVLIWGRGSACIYDQKEDGPRWLPERLIKHINHRPAPPVEPNQIPGNNNTP
nr:pol protein [Desmodus rotundus endogenous retrovirus]